MAAMFQAQSANWEETQEKMSQLVSPLGALLPLSCSNFSNTPLSALLRAVFFPSPRPFSVRPGFIRTHVERVSVAEARRMYRITNRTIGRSRLVMCATVAGRKVCFLMTRAPLPRACV